MGGWALSKEAALLRMLQQSIPRDALSAGSWEVGFLS